MQPHSHFYHDLFLSIWGRTLRGVQRVTSKVRNFFWVGKDRRARARVVWDAICLKRKEGELNMVNPKHALTTLLYKCIVFAYEPRGSNFKILLR
jgi:hypothetical protein